MGAWQRSRSKGHVSRYRNLYQRQIRLTMGGVYCVGWPDHRIVTRSY
nr:MAG TPA: phosphoribosylformylglycinamidine synthase II [Caudoviricetes sp.]